MRSFALFLALAVPVATASAAPYTTTDPHPLNKVSTQANHSQWIRMSFRNTTLKGRVLTIGANQFDVPVGKTLDLAVATGSTVHVSSPWDSHLNKTLMQVTAADADRTVTVQ